jgi:hypothetical protein
MGRKHKYLATVEFDSWDDGVDVPGKLIAESPAHKTYEYDTWRRRAAGCLWIVYATRKGRVFNLVESELTHAGLLVFSWPADTKKKPPITRPLGEKVWPPAI